MYDLIIIGSGPAGLGAAIYGKRAGLSVLVLEMATSGGQVLTTYEVDNYLGMPGIGGFEMGMQFREHADKMQVEFSDLEVLKIEDQGSSKLVITEQGELECRAVIIASGAKHSHLEVEGEERLTGMGVSYCATCDGAFFRNRTVAVVGGGDVAAEDAIFLARTCEKVYVIHRRAELRAAGILQQNLLSLPNLEIIWDSVVTRIQGQDSVEALHLQNTVTGEETDLPVDGVFVAVGIRPYTEAFRGLVDMDQGGYIIADESCETSVPGIFVAGDARTKHLRQIVTAVADGANAVAGVQRYFVSLDGTAG